MMWEFIFFKREITTLYILLQIFYFYHQKILSVYMFMVFYQSNGSSKNLKSEVSKGITITLLLLLKKTHVYIKQNLGVGQITKGV